MKFFFETTFRSCMGSLILTGILVHFAKAQELDLQIRRDTANQSLSIAIAPGFFGSPCRYVLRGAPSKKALSADSSRIFTMRGTNLDTAITVPDPGKLRKRRRLRQKRATKRPRIFFKLVAECPVSTIESKIVRYRPRARGKKGLRGAKAWLAELRREFGYNQAVLQDAFPNLNLTAPTDIQHAGDGTNRLFIAEKGGALLVLENSREAHPLVFLDLTGRVDTAGERGLVGVAFHPKYEENGYLYVHYSRESDGNSIIARFSVRSDDPNRVDPDSELELLRLSQATNVHVGGQLAFGPDGYLYVALGDGGPQNDGKKHGQNLSTLLASILRIDVDNPSAPLNYGIPADNPFAGNTEGYREEIFAYGFRNPFRISFDPATGQLYVGDVGQNTYEEVDIVTKGGNYGWSILEGKSCFNPPVDCDRSGLVEPIIDYDRHWGRAVIGGRVYRGQSIPGYVGKYVFADYVGTVFALLTDLTGNTHQLLLFETGNYLSTFGVDENQELYLGDYETGKIYRFAPFDGAS